MLANVSQSSNTCIFKRQLRGLIWVVGVRRGVNPSGNNLPSVSDILGQISTPGEGGGGRGRGKSGEQERDNNRSGFSASDMHRRVKICTQNQIGGGEEHDNVEEMSLCKIAVHGFIHLHSDKCVGKRSHCVSIIVDLQKQTH